MNHRSAGISMIELITAFAVMGLTMTVTMSFIFGVRQKAILRNETDKLATVLGYARQQSVAAYKGEAHGVEFAPPNRYVIVPEETERKFRSGVSYNSESLVNKVEFRKLTGQVEQPITIELQSGSLTTTISIDEEGFITYTEPE